MCFSNIRILQLYPCTYCSKAPKNTALPRPKFLPSSLDLDPQRLHQLLHGRDLVPQPLVADAQPGRRPLQQLRPLLRRRPRARQRCGCLMVWFGGR